MYESLGRRNGAASRSVAAKSLKVSTSLEPGERSETLLQMSVVLFVDGSLARIVGSPRLPLPAT